MAPNLEAKKYDCPNCRAQITTAEYKISGKKCPNCGIKLEQIKEPNLIGAGFKYSFIIVNVPGQSELVVQAEKKMYKKVSRPDERPLVFRLMPEFAGNGIPEFIITYVNIPPRQTELYCPVCGSYALTTGTISGNTIKYGPCNRNDRKTGARCKSIILFEFVASNELLFVSER